MITHSLFEKFCGLASYTLKIWASITTPLSVNKYYWKRILAEVYLTLKSFLCRYSFILLPLKTNELETHVQTTQEGTLRTLRTEGNRKRINTPPRMRHVLSTPLVKLRWLNDKSSLEKHFSMSTDFTSQRLQLWTTLMKCCDTKCFQLLMCMSSLYKRIFIFVTEYRWKIQDARCKGCFTMHVGKAASPNINISLAIWQSMVLGFLRNNSWEYHVLFNI